MTTSMVGRFATVGLVVAGLGLAGCGKHRKTGKQQVPFDNIEIVTTKDNAVVHNDHVYAVFPDTPEFSPMDAPIPTGGMLHAGMFMWTDDDEGFLGMMVIPLPDEFPMAAKDGLLKAMQQGAFGNVNATVDSETDMPVGSLPGHSAKGHGNTQGHDIEMELRMTMDEAHHQVVAIMAGWLKGKTSFQTRGGTFMDSLVIGK